MMDLLCHPGLQSSSRRRGSIHLVLLLILTAFFVACSDDNSDVVTPPAGDSSSSVCDDCDDGSSSSVTPKSNDSETSVSSSSTKSSSSSAESSSSSQIGCKTETEDNCEYGELVDDRDSQTYKTVKIGKQWWMAENLNYEGGDSYCYNDSAEYCEEYGRLYTWVSARDACPTGWHLPTREDLDTLLSTVGGDSLAGNVLKSFAGWNRAEDEGNGVDSYGFSGSPAGWMDLTGDYYQVGYFGRFWSISSCSDKKAYTLHLKYNAESGSLDCTLKESAISVRCVKD